MNKLKLYVLSIIIGTASSVFAEVDKNDLNYCNVTKIEINDYEPKVFEKSNDFFT